MSLRNHLLRTLLVSAALLAADARAETATTATELGPQSKIFRYAVAQAQLETMFVAGREQDLALRLEVDCHEQMQVRPLQMFVLTTIDLPDDRANPIAGTWQARYDVERCGRSKTYNVVLRADPAGGKPRKLAQFPGTSRASVTLIRDAIVGVGAKALAAAGDPACKAPVLADMRVDQGPHRVDEGGVAYEDVWNETWTFDVCGRAVDAAVRFVPTPRDGGTDWSVTFPAGPPRAN